MNYKGTVNKTRTGKDCKVWAKGDNEPISHVYHFEGDHNFCRNPIRLGLSGGRIPAKGAKSVWCYTTDPGTTWDYCDVRECNECDQGEEHYHYFDLWLKHKLNLTQS